jgi:SAM-dependent methyltransferase
MAQDNRFSVFSKIELSPAVAVEGQVFTKAHVVQLILDLAGYTPDRPLRSLRLLDAGCGDGRFLVEAADRLLASAGPVEGPDLSASLLGVEKDRGLANKCRGRLRKALTGRGLESGAAERLSRGWVRCGDFLPRPPEGPFDFIVGNPPYVRQEAIPKDSLAFYRDTFSCFSDRADLYVAFIEQGLRLLSGRGVLAFICPDRFTRNQYGKRLRRLITESFHVRQVVDLSRASPFEPEVICYPGIFVIGQEPVRHVDYVRLTEAGPQECDEARRLLAAGEASNGAEGPVTYHRYEHWFSGDQQWAVASPAHTALLRKLEAKGPPLGSQSSGCAVGIGVATGADDVFIVTPEAADVEPELLMPLVMTRDVASGRVSWSNRHVINPFASEGSDELIDLARYPRARKYFLSHEKRLRGRHVGMRNPARWYRTIDRITPSLRRRPKLLIPDIKARNVVALEHGELYPHHNLYFVTSDYWDLAALRTILRSSVAKFFVWMYGVKMRGGWLRYQAQYLRKIRVPPLTSIGAATVRRLKRLDGEEDLGAIDGAVAGLYSLSGDDLELIRDVTASG